MTRLIALFRRILHWLRTFHCAECEVRKPNKERQVWYDKQGSHDVCRACYSHLWHERNDKALAQEYRQEVANQRRLLKARRQAREELRAEQVLRNTTTEDSE